MGNKTDLRTESLGCPTRPKQRVGRAHRPHPADIRRIIRRITFCFVRKPCSTLPLSWDPKKVGRAITHNRHRHTELEDVVRHSYLGAFDILRDNSRFSTMRTSCQLVLFLLLTIAAPVKG